MIPEERIVAHPAPVWQGRSILIFLAILLAFGGRKIAVSQKASLRPPSCPLLLPIPRECEATTVASLAHGVLVTTGSDAEDRFAAHDLSTWLDTLHVPQGNGRAAYRVELLRAHSLEARRLLLHAEAPLDAPMREEGYVILPGTGVVSVIAETAAGLFYGVQTMKQMVSGSGASATLNVARIRDWPAMRYRGVSDDLSRGPIPTLDFEKREIRTLAAYKINVYSPYFENTLQYQFNPLPALPGGSMTQAEARDLVEYAQRYHVMIVPEQESFGHLHHVLKYEQYAPLAETPLGSVLAPGQPGSMDLIVQWFNEIANIFPAPFLHVGADETFDLGRGQTKAAVETRGLGPVYVDFLTSIHDRLAPLHRRLLFWGDVGMKDPEQVKRLPKDMIAVAWDYNPSPAGYRQWLAPYLAAGMETWVAPGVNNWNRVYPDNDYALSNIQRFVADGQEAHSTGVLNTIWNDDGEGLLLDDWYGLLFGAAAAWQPGTSSIEQFQASYGSLFHGDATGSVDEAQRQLIAVSRMLDQANITEPSDRLFWMDPWSPEGQAEAAKLNPLIPGIRQSAERAIVLLSQARNAGALRETDALDALELGARRLDFIGQKFESAEEISRLYGEAYASRSDAAKSREVRRILETISGTNGLCQDMRDGYSFSRERYATLWLRENRPYWLENVLARYDLAIQLWTARGNKFGTVIDGWDDHHTLPPPEALGLPANKPWGE